MAVRTEEDVLPTGTVSGQRTLSQNGMGAFQLPDGRQVTSGAPTSELPFWHEKWTLVFILVFLVEMASPLRSAMGIGAQWTGRTTISTLCV